MRAFLPWFRPYAGRLAALAAAVAGATLAEGCGIGLFFPLAEYIEKGPSFLEHGRSRPLFEALAAAGLEPSVGLLIALVFSVLAAALALRLAVLRLSASVYNAAMRDIRTEAFRRILSSHVFRFYGGQSSTAVQTLENEVEHVGQTFNYLVVAAGAAGSIAVYGAITLAMSWRLTLAVAAIGALRYAVSSLFIPRMRTLGALHGELRERLKASVIAVHQGIDVVKSFGTEEREIRRFSDLAAEIRRTDDAVVAAAGGNSFAEGLLGDGALCVLVFVAVERLGVSGATLIMFLFVITRIIPKVTAVNDARIRVAEYLSKLRDLPAVMSERGLPALSWGAAEKAGFESSLELRGAVFAYPGASRPAVDGVTLALRRGETVALVGGSGAGKSTVARLFLRLFDPQQGELLVDGAPARSLRREHWTRLVGVVGQDTFVFDDTLENNVKYGVEDCTDAAFQKALEDAQAADFVRALPDGPRTRLGERGVLLSGGQRQRIAVARAFLRDAPILILDEATSAMDAETERQIQGALERLSRDRTVLVIAHRFTTIRKADRIAVLEDGRLAELGTHAELLAKGGLYSRFDGLQR